MEMFRKKKSEKKESYKHEKSTDLTGYFILRLLSRDYQTSMKRPLKTLAKPV